MLVGVHSMWVYLLSPRNETQRLSVSGWWDYDVSHGDI